MIWYNNIILWYVIYIIQYQCKPNKIQIFLFLHRHDIYNINVNPIKYKYLSNCWQNIYNINVNLNWYTSPIPRARRAQRNPTKYKYLSNCWHDIYNINVFVHLTHENIIFDTPEESSFQKYTTCWVFVALCQLLYLCICVFVYLYFVFVRLRHVNIIVGIPDQSSFQKYTTCWVFEALCHLLYLCICVFVYLYFCICAFETCEHHSWYPWTILFSKIYHKLGLSGTL